MTVDQTVNVLALTRYGTLGPSTRVRFEQFEPMLAERGVAVDYVPMLGDAHLRRVYAGQPRRPLSVAAAYVRHGWAAARRGSEVVWIEKEILPYVPAAVERWLVAGTPYVLDYDDATFHTYDRHSNPLVRRALGRKVRRLMRGAALVIVGNDYLARYARQSGAPRVEVVPSAVDLDRYGPVTPPPGGAFTVGWIGSPGSERVLESFRETALEVTSWPDTRLVLVGASPRALPGVAHETWTWTENSEVDAMRAFHVGIMPLPDLPWERGKCGFKLIQCMGAGRPVVASPVGVNAEIVRDGVDGFHASDTTSWVRALARLRDDASLRDRMGASGRERVESRYSVGAVAPRLATLLRGCA